MRAARRRRLDPQVRRQELIEAAERLLKARGPVIRVDDVVQEAGAAKGTFYLYFSTWDDLLETLRTRVFEAFLKQHPIPRGPDTAIDWPALFCHLGEAFVDAVGAMGGLHEALFHSDFAQRRPMPAEVHPVGRLAALIGFGQTSKGLAEVDPGPTARLLFAILHETADAVAAGEDRQGALRAMNRTVRKMLEVEMQG
jgi:AcrR family transcriptional regulator